MSLSSAVPQALPRPSEVRDRASRDVSSRARRSAPVLMLDTTRPAMVLDGGARADLGLVRSLGMAGIPVHLLTWLRSSVTGESRYVTQTHAFPQFGADDEERIARLRAIARSLPARPVILASGDRSLRFLSRCRGKIEDVIDHDLASPRVIDACLDKARFARIAEALGFPVPRSWSPLKISGAQAMSETLTYPVFVKPLRGDRGTATPSGAGMPGKGWQVRDAAALRAHCAVLETNGIQRVIIQEYVPGPDSGLVSVHVYIEPSGRVAGAFTGKKSRCFPPDAGIGTHVISEYDDALVATSVQILAQLAYTGFAILQFKRDVRDGTMKLLEINCRYGTWTELPSRAGCNFPAAAYAALTKQRVPVLEQCDGMVWLDLARDFQAFSTYRREGSWTWRGYLRSLRGVRCWAFFAPDDPAPFFWQLWRRAAQ